MIIKLACLFVYWKVDATDFCVVDLRGNQFERDVREMRKRHEAGGEPVRGEGWSVKIQLWLAFVWQSVHVLGHRFFLGLWQEGKQAGRGSMCSRWSHAEGMKTWTDICRIQVNALCLSSLPPVRFGFSSQHPCTVLVEGNIPILFSAPISLPTHRLNESFSCCRGDFAWIEIAEEKRRRKQKSSSP